MTHLGLFAGIGGFELPARWLGWETKAVCEWDSFCQAVLKHHFPNAEQYSDIRTANFTRYAGQIDVLTGGFPCQPYSSAGKRLGKEDERHLWPEMLRAIQEVAPRWVVGENVRGLVNWNGGVVFDEVQSDLEAAGYEVLPFLLPACGVDAPHERYRIWFVARRINPNTYNNGSHVSENRQGMGKGNDGNAAWQNKAIKLEGCSIQDAITTSNAIKGRLEGRNGEREGGRREQGFGTEALYRADNWKQFPAQPPICSGNDGLSPELAVITVSRHRRESLKAYGNAIVPQVAYQIFKAINQYEK